MTDAGPAQPGSWEQRWHPLREEWVIVAAHRQHRPWTGKTVAAAAADAPGLRSRLLPLPGERARRRARSTRATTSTFVFDNDHPCVGADAPRERRRPAAALPRVARRRRRARRLLLAAPRSDAGRDAAGGDRRGRRRLARARRASWARARRFARCCASRTRATSSASPTRTRTARSTRRRSCGRRSRSSWRASERHQRDTGRGLMEDIIRAEQQDGRRVLHEDEHVIAFVPYFARYAYEVYVVAQAARARTCSS